MDFKSFVDSKYMETFSDSMFTTLKQNNIIDSDRNLQLGWGFLQLHK